MENDKFIVRTMILEELDFAMELAALEGWNPGLHDAACFYHTDPEGFFIGLLDDTPIGCISSVAYKGGFGHIGLHFVLPEYQGHNYEKQLWNRAMKYQKQRNTGIDIRPDRVSLYKDSGFIQVGKHIRFQVTVTETLRNSPHIIDLAQIPFTEICQVDHYFFPTIRENFLQCWISMPESKAFAFLKKNQLYGFGVIRRCRTGYRIGPLFAWDAAMAKELFLALSTCAGKGSTVFLDVPEQNEPAMELAREFKMTQVLETIRMYSNNRPILHENGIFGITTYALG